MSSFLVLLRLIFELFCSEDRMPFGALFVVYQATAVGGPRTRRCMRDTPLSLLPNNRLDLAKLYLNLSGDRFSGAFSF
jgi:hypothetical protein